jgi:multiple sugar transport system permease protein
VFDIICLVFLLVLVVLWLAPTLWAINTSLKTNGVAALGAGEILADTHWTLDSYAQLLSGGSMSTWLLSSAVISLTVVALTVLLASLAAYALSRLQFRGKNVVLGVILAGLMIPPQVLIVPWFREFSGLGLLNTYWAVILPAVPQVVAVFVFKQFFDGLPKEIEESARLDGASYWTIYRMLIMPLSRPAVSAVAIFTLVVTWNDLLWPLVALTNPDIMTVPVGLATVGGTFSQRYADTMAAALVGALPLLLLFLFFQRRIVEGIAGTGLKG